MYIHMSFLKFLCPFTVPMLFFYFLIFIIFLVLGRRLKMKNNVFSKKTAALLAAVGLTVGLLAPFTTNISALTQDNGIKIGTRTAGDAEELTGTLDYNDYKGNDQQFIKDIEKSLSNDDYLTLINMPEGYQLDLVNEKEDWYYPSLDIIVGDPETDNIKYQLQAEYLSTNEIHVVLPDFEDFYSTYDKNVDGMVVKGTKYVSFHMPKGYESNDEVWYAANVNCGYIDLSSFGEIVYMHNYTLKNGITDVIETTGETYVWFSGSDTSTKTFIANQCYDGSQGPESTYSINTWDAINEDFLNDLRETMHNRPYTDIYTYSAGPKQTNIPADFFALFKEENKRIRFNMNTKSDIRCSLTFDRVDKALDFNPQINVSEKEINGAKAFVFDFEHSGVLPGTMTVRAFVGVDNNAPKAYLYYVNEDGTLEKMDSGAKLALGYAEFTIDHCSSYVVSASDLTGSQVPETPVDPGNQGNDDDKQPGNEQTAGNDQNTNVDLTESPETGNASAMNTLLSMAALSGVLAATVGIRRHKVKE